MATVNTSVNLTTPTVGSSLLDLLMADEIVPGREPSYQICKTIYLFHPLGAKMAEAPIRMAQSQQRKISVPNSPEERVVEKFEDQWKVDGADLCIAQTRALSRVYGVSSLALLAVGVPVDRPIDPKRLSELTIAFNVYDPLNTSGSMVLNQNPRAMNFMKAQDISVQGNQFHRSRSCIMVNEQPIYLAYTNSAFGFTGRSVYQRALFPLKSFIDCLITDNLVVRKVGVLVAKMKPAGSIVDQAMAILTSLKRSIVQQAKSENVISIHIDEAIESLNLQNLDAPYSLARKNIIENIATGCDMPAKILLQETFAEGFGEGSEDAKYIVQFIDRERETMQPLYDFMTPIVQHRAWTEGFYKTLQRDFQELKNKTYTQAFYEWQNSFKAEWPNLLREPESELVTRDQVKLQAAREFAQVILPEADPVNKAIIVQWLADNVNENKMLFKNPLVLDMEAWKAHAEEKKAQDDEAKKAAMESAKEPKEPALKNDADTRKLVIAR